MLAGLGKSLHVTFENRLEGLLVLPFRVLGCQRLHAIERKCKLDIHWLLQPQGAVIVEHRDAFGRWHEIRSALDRDPCDEVSDCLLCSAVVPRGERVSLTLSSRRYESKPN